MSRARGRGETEESNESRKPFCFEVVVLIWPLHRSFCPLVTSFKGQAFERRLHLCLCSFHCGSVLIHHKFCIWVFGKHLSKAQQRAQLWIESSCHLRVPLGHTEGIKFFQNLNAIPAEPQQFVQNLLFSNDWGSSIGLGQMNSLDTVVWLPIGFACQKVIKMSQLCLDFNHMTTRMPQWS